MKHYKYFIIPCLLVFVIACQTELDTLSKESSPEYAKTFIIAPEEAVAQAQQFRANIKGTTRADASNRVASVYAWRSSDIYADGLTRNSAGDVLPDTLLYIVNFDGDDGYALVSSNTRYRGVVAYIEDGHLTPDDEIDNPGFEIFLEGYRDYFGGIPVDTSEIIPIHEDPGDYGEATSMYELVYSAGPLLTTNWGQREPYNYYCFTDNGHQAPAGCVAIALGQIAAYHQHPTSYNGHVYNWDAIMQYEQVPISDTLASNSVAELIHDIGLLVFMHYTDSASGAYFEDVYYCLDAFDYHNQMVYDVNFDSISTDIINSKPVYMRGVRTYIDSLGQTKYVGHAWVVDGVVVKSYTVEEVDRMGHVVSSFTDYRNYVHCNWGWNGNSNGYFIIGAFEKQYDIVTDVPTDGYRAYNLYNRMYYSIYPN